METLPLRKTAPIVAAGVAAILLVYVRFRPWDLHDGPMIGAPFGRDFVNFWIAGHLALTHSLGVLTDLPAYNALVARTFDHTRNDAFIFSYPPHLLLVLAPLAALPYRVALAVWTGANLLGLVAASRIVAAGRRQRGFIALATCLSPAASMMVLYGHFGGVLALLFAIILRDGERRPGLTGLCLAALTAKPQFAVVVALVLLGAGRWRCLPVAAAATAAWVALSVAVFGLEPWHGFLTVTLPEQSRMLSAFDAGMLGTTISPYLGARLIGLTSATAWALQLATGAGALAIAVAALRRTPTGAFLAVPLAAVFALPYANHYDLVVAAPALTLWVLTQGEASPAAIARLLTWMAPPLTWHLVWLRIPIVPVAGVAALAGTFGAGLGEVARAMFGRGECARPSEDPAPLAERSGLSP